MSRNEELFCLIGHPTQGSKSPVVHETLLREMGMHGLFFNFDVAPELLSYKLEELKALNIKGFSVTIPYKETVLPYMDELHPSAKEMGAVNSVCYKDGRLIGYNTDGDGLLLALEESKVKLSGAKILVLGSGGAARGIVHALGRRTQLSPCEVILWNRTLERAQTLAAEVNTAYGCDFKTTLDQHDASVLNVDLVINTTSVGMMPHVSDTPCEPERYGVDTVFCDIVYKPHETLMLKKARESGHGIVHGIDMLIYQAIISQVYWHEGDAQNPFPSQMGNLTELKKRIFEGIEKTLK